MWRCATTRPVLNAQESEKNLNATICQTLPDVKAEDWSEVEVKIPRSQERREFFRPDSPTHIVDHLVYPQPR